MHRTLTLFLLLFVVSVQAQPIPFTVSGEVRHRSELDARDFRGTDDPILYHLLRTRLGVRAQPSPRLTAFVQIQDARFFGGENPSLGRGVRDADADQLDFHQAFLDVDSLFGTGLGVRVGRQELAYGNQRLLSSLGWSNVGQSFDGAVVRLRRGRLAADAFAAQLVSPVNPLGGAGSQNIFGLYTAWALSDTHALDAFVVYDNATQELTAGPDAGQDSLARVTPGLYAHGTAGRFDYRAEAIGQFGQRTLTAGGQRLDVQASLFSVNAGYVALTEHAVRVGAAYTRLSGDDDPIDDTFGYFDMLFPLGHAFFGFMDYFPARAAPYGVQNAVVSVTGNVTRTLRVGLDAHHFATAAEAPMGRTLGQEIDLTGVYRPMPGFAVSAGASVFLPGEVVEATLGDETTTWFYLTSSLIF
ncbi:MAG: alginate export family protein [Rhodothermaceae bacterium]|nr:alginate export family protein [Rhodothermaceae bacterium]